MTASGSGSPRWSSCARSRPAGTAMPPSPRCKSTCTPGWPATRCRGRSGWWTRSAVRCPARPTTAGPGGTSPSTPRPGRPGNDMTVRTPVCDLLGIEHPIVGFSPSEHVAAAISRAGGMGVLGCVRFNDPAELDAVLDWMDAHTDGRPYGVDVVMPARVPTEGTPTDLAAMIPQAHRGFVAETLQRLGVPPLPESTAEDSGAADGVVGWLHSIARKHVEVALAHPARLIANALGPPPPDVMAAAHERGMVVAALAGKAEHARVQVGNGVDIVVAQGHEAGGHTGEIGTMVLIPEVVDAVGDQVPVLAAGGIGCGRQVAAALALGAAGAWMGSAWLLTSEYAQLSSSPAVQQALLAA